MSEESDRYLGKILVARTAQGQVVGVGRCVSYTDKPTVAVRRPDGSLVNWRADMCEILTSDESVAEALVPFSPPHPPPPTQPAGEPFKIGG